jgi:hypothetical protein
MFVVGVMHFVAYRAFVAAPTSAQFELIAKAFPDVAERHPGSTPDGFWDFLRRMAAAGRPMPFGWTARGAMAWASWGLDAALLASAAIVTISVARRPYCDVCHSYYRVVRRETLGAEQCAALAKSLDRSVLSGHAAEFELAGCREGCSPDRVKIGLASGQGRETPQSKWIARADRARLFQQLDQSA